MILIIEIGNSNIVLGVFQDSTLLTQWRIRTDLSKTSDEYLVDINNFIQLRGFEVESIEKTVLASVVTSLIPILQKSIFDLTGRRCLLVDLKSVPDMPIKVDNPDEVGIDRIINAYAGYDLYHKALIVIDLGTATTFDVISKDGEFIGGVISPGLLLSLNALVSNTSKLPKIELDQPRTVIGKNTVHCMQSGILYGYAGMIDAMITKIKKELGYDATVVATGGLASVVQPVADQIDIIAEDLTLKGLLKISQLLSE